MFWNGDCFDYTIQYKHGIIFKYFTGSIIFIIHRTLGTYTYNHWSLFKKEMSLINQINSKQYNIGDLSPEEIELLRKSKKEISDRVKELMEKDPELFTCKPEDIC